MIELLFSNPTVFAVFASGLVIAIAIHEFAHAWMADRLGDPTPGAMGRLTLNPMAHLDPLGTILIFFVGFGWGKPVQFDPYNLDDPKRDTMLIALAGPVSNLILAGIFALGLGLLFNLSPEIGTTALPQAITQIIFINVMLALFNLIPIHPLDGGKILVGLLPDDMAREADEFLGRYGILILFLLIMPIGPGGQSPVSALIGHPIQMLTGFYLQLAQIL